ncbi:5,6-dimethylbenzimidazole synthase [Kiloniella antarctica]|uniref:5,6-dimethylbenzimidazole synthase n=1 Tax=Kiloniella antarctica TaxID=1550907 RepID=A0ABW5BKM1_9PROT
METRDQTVFNENIHTKNNTASTPNYNNPAFTDHSFSEAERDALYQTIFSRRDVRGQFTSKPVPEEVLSRILTAAHYAPSVGFMQPWNFILIRKDETKQRVHNLFKKAHDEAADMFEGEKRDTYKNLKLEGIKESPLNICITCDKDRTGPIVIGRTHIKAMDLYSTVCAVQNLWLAARSEGVGVGWVSILDQKKLKQILKLPKRVTPVAYLCLGYVSEFFDKPELQLAGWLPRLPMADVVNFEEFDKTADDPFATSLLETLEQNQRSIEDGQYRK